MSVLRKVLTNRNLKKRVVALSCFQKRCYSSENKYEVTSDYPDIDIPSVKIDEVVFENMGRWHNRVALVSAIVN